MESMIGKWEHPTNRRFGESDESYKLAAEWLGEQVEDWGCGTAYAKQFFTEYRGVDGSGLFADEIADLQTYRSNVPYILTRHTLEHNYNWRVVLDNLLRSFTKRAVIVLFKPLEDKERVTSVCDSIPDIALPRDEFLDFINPWLVKRIDLTHETVFYLERKKPYDIAIATTCYFEPYGTIKDEVGIEFRRQSFLAMLHSIGRVDWGAQKAIVCVRVDGGRPPEIPEIGIPIQIIVNPEKAGCPLNLTLACDDAQKHAPWVLYVDNDGLFAKDSIKRLFKLIARYPDMDAFGLFNTKYHETIEEHPDHVLKHSLCEHGICFKTTRWDFRLSYGGISFPAAAQYRSPYPTLKPSGVQHCGGKYGLNGTEGDFDADFRE